MKLQRLRIIFLLISFLFINLIAHAQSDSHRMSETEKTAMPEYLRSISHENTTGFTSPPASPVRASAEWEEIDALIITWTTYPSILKDIIRYSQTETQVLIVCGDSNAVKTYLTNNGIPLINLHYIITPFNTVWARDYGPWNIYTSDVDSLELIDWIYNRPRPEDDQV